MHLWLIADACGSHALSWKKTAGRHAFHSAVNDLIQRALSSANIPSRLEPTGFSRNDGKRPDGLTLRPWANGRFYCVILHAASILNRAVLGPSNIACDAERRKIC